MFNGIARARQGAPVRRGSILFCVFLIVIAVGSIVLARGWVIKASLFPLSVGIPLLVLATIQLLIVLFGQPESGESDAMDIDFATDVPVELVRRRVLGVFAWIVGFIAMVYFLGFPLTVPLFIFLYLKFQSDVGWLPTIVTAAVTWVCFHLLFESLVHIQFEAGALQTWLGM
jgi:Tripartite tricarboxylate transporter TctB family